jgi:glycosyltransferase involved in cell wall biosynthesis
MKTWKSAFVGDIDAVAAVSQPVLDAHLRHGLFHHMAPRHRRVIWNGVEQAARAGERTGALTFGFLGRLVPEKGIGVLLEACRRLPPEGWRLRVAGRAPHGAPRFEPLAQGLPVEFLGFTDARDFLSSIDVLVAPSIWDEPFGLTIVEAYAAGAAVIGSDRGAIGDLVGSVTPDWVVAGGDVAALAGCMARVLQGGRARLPAPRVFEPVLAAASPGAMTAAYLDLYRDVLRAQTRGRERRRAPIFGKAEFADAHPAP